MSQKKYLISFLLMWLTVSSLLLAEDVESFAPSSVTPLEEAPTGVYHRELSFYHVQGKEVLHGAFRESMGERLLTSGNYVRGNKDGLWEEWHVSGLPKSNQLWRAGARHGLYREWYASGNLMAKVLYEDGKKQGSEELWYEQGERKSYTTWQAGVRHGAHQEWHLNGQETLRCLYEHGQLNGPLKRWNENGEVILEEIYQNGSQRKILLSSEKYNNDTMKVAYSYYLDDLKQEVRHGRFSKWFPNGEIWIQCDYVHGKIDGIWQYGKLDGLHCRQESYQMGVKHGPFKWYHQGKLIREEIWRDGEKIQIKEY